MTHTRRNILKGAAAGVAGTALASPAMAMLGGRLEPVPPIQDARLRELIKMAVDAAISAGASYADARLTYVRRMAYGRQVPERTEEMGFGVRVNVKGYWGFASSPVWNSEDASRLGCAAYSQGAANFLGEPREIDLAPLTNVTSGDWVMPVKDDPFNLHYDELADYIAGLGNFIRSLKYHNGQSVRFEAVCEEKAFGSSLGQFFTQKTYNTSGALQFHLFNRGREAEVNIDRITPAGLGFEHLRDQPLRKYILEEHEVALQDLDLEVRPVDVGRYTTLINQYALAKIMAPSIGQATEVDRALGYEANAGGTSYIVHPLEMLGTLKIGNPLVNISGGRSDDGSVNKVKWDDEGVAPVNFDIVREGILANMQTSREGAGWIRSHYEKSNQPFASFGCTSAPTAIDVQSIHSADLTLKPGQSTEIGIDELREQMGDGIEFQDTYTNMDFQLVTGYTAGKAYEIKNGKRTALIADAGLLYRTPEFWGNLTHLGGASNVRRFGIESKKGQPEQRRYLSVNTPAALFKEMTVIDVKRKA